MRRILYIVPSNPFRNDSGSFQRTNLILKTLMASFEVDLICFTDDKFPDEKMERCHILYWNGLLKESNIMRFLNLFRTSLNSVYFAPSSVKRKLEKLIDESKYDYVLFRYILPVGWCNLKLCNSKIIIDVDDLPRDTFMAGFKECSSYMKKGYFLYMALKADFFTKIILRKVTHCFFSNPLQCVYSNSSFLPNIPFPRQKDMLVKPFEQRGDIVLFVGLLSYSPNYLGLDFFITNIWLEVLKVNPKAVLKIVGKGLPYFYFNKWKTVSNVEILGYVEELEKEYLNCKVVIAPVYSGAGTNIKVLEAMSMKRPVVVSNFACRGFELDLLDDVNVFVANSSEDYCNKVLTLLLSKEKNLAMANNAYDLIVNKYSFQTFSEYLNCYL